MSLLNLASGFNLADCAETLLEGTAVNENISISGRKLGNLDIL